MILFVFVAIALRAQPATISESKQLLQKVADKYRNAAHLSFDIAYYYAANKTPVVYLDSLQGHFKMNGSHYWFEVAGTESLYSDQYAMVLYKDDKLMYLTKPTASITNPVASLDDFLKADTLYTCSVTHEKQFDKLAIDFKARGAYKRTEYFIDTHTGFITRMVSWVRSELLYDPSAIPAIDQANAYSIVEMQFSHYQENSFDDKVLDTAQYFKKEGNEYVTVAPYETYKIFIGSPNL
jgi:hypothetical protein